MRTNKFKAPMYILLISNFISTILYQSKSDFYMTVVVICLLGVVEAIEIAADRITNE